MTCFASIPIPEWERLRFLRFFSGGPPVGDCGTSPDETAAGSEGLGSMRWRLAPVQASAEVASLPPAFAEMAQGGVLAGLPDFFRGSDVGKTGRSGLDVPFGAGDDLRCPVAEPPCSAAAVCARPEEALAWGGAFMFHSEDLEAESSCCHAGGGGGGVGLSAGPTETEQGCEVGGPKLKTEVRKGPKVPPLVFAWPTMVKGKRRKQKNGKS